MNFNKRNITIISFLLAIIIFLLVNLFLSQCQKNEEKTDLSVAFKASTSSLNNNEIENLVGNQYIANSEWRIEIPAINLDAPILEGTTNEVMRKAVGHFEESKTWDGNVCLAAHNRGYKYNFFQEIKKLKIGDYIKYTTSQGTKLYQVVVNNVIEETDWSYIENTNDNRITLITCVENKPTYRQCVQAKEV